MGVRSGTLQLLQSCLEISGRRHLAFGMPKSFARDRWQKKMIDRMVDRKLMDKSIAKGRIGMSTESRRGMD